MNNIEQDRTDHTARTGPVGALRRELAARHQARATRRQLERDLASYTTQAEVDDLYAILDRHDDSESAPLRDILTRRRLPAA